MSSKCLRVTIIFFILSSSSTSSSLLFVNCQPFKLQNDDLKTQESFDHLLSSTTKGGGGALGPILGDHFVNFNDDHHKLPPPPPPPSSSSSMKYRHNNDNFNDVLMIASLPINSDNSYGNQNDDYYKYGGILGTKILNEPFGHNKNYGVYGGGDRGGGGAGGGDSNSNEHLDQGLYKLNKQHKQDKYGGKTDNRKNFDDSFVYKRNRGYGYEKHYVYDKEYSTGKSKGSKKHFHSYYGDHDHGTKSIVDMHKKYDKDSGHHHDDNDHHFDYEHHVPYLVEHHDDNDPKKFIDLNKKNLLKHKKQYLSKYLENNNDNHYHTHYNHGNHHHHDDDYSIPSTIDSIGGHHNNGYSRLTPFLGTTYHHGHYGHRQHSNSYIPQNNRYFDGDGIYLSSSSSDNKLLNKAINKNSSILDNGMDTEGESINTLLPSKIVSNVDDNDNNKIINMSPLISTRLSSSSSSTLMNEPIIEQLVITKTLPSSSSNTIAESFARIQSAVHATPPVIPTHVYDQIK